MRIRTNLTGFLICLAILVVIAIITQSEAVGCLVIINIIILIITIIRNQFSKPTEAKVQYYPLSNNQEKTIQIAGEELYDTEYKQQDIASTQGEENKENYGILSTLAENAVNFILKKEEGFEYNQVDILKRYYIQSCVAKAMGIVFILGTDKLLRDEESGFLLKTIFQKLNDNFDEIASELQMTLRKIHDATQPIDILVGENFSINIIETSDDVITEVGRKHFFSGVTRGKYIVTMIFAQIRTH